MTQLLLECECEGQVGLCGIAFQKNEQARAQLELEQYIEEQADAKAPFALTYSFNYNQFVDPKLQSKARTTLFNCPLLL